MINVAYRDFKKNREGSITIGAVSDQPAGEYLWHYWVPVLLLLDPAKFRLCSLEDALVKEQPFLYPIELRWEFIEWLEDGMIETFLTPHIPGSVVDAARKRKAVIVICYGHEGRPLSYRSHLNGEWTTVYDRLNDFVSGSELPLGSVWFINGNLRSDAEFLQWESSIRDGSGARFVMRRGEYFSYMTQKLRRLQESGHDITMYWDLLCSESGMAHHGIEIEIQPLTKPLVEIYADDVTLAAAHSPSRLFLCMNRITREHRRHLVVWLQRFGLIDRSLISFKDEEAENVRYEDDDLQAAWEGIKKSQPFVIDREDMPSNWNLGGGQRVKLDDFFYIKSTEAWPYRESLLSIVTETQYRHDLLYPSEKIWKPIVQGLPFIVVGTPGLLRYLRDIGFRTFSPLIDESYDCVEDDSERLAHIVDALADIGRKSPDQLRALQESLRLDASHNLSHLQTMKTPMEELLDEISSYLLMPYECPPKVQ